VHCFVECWLLGKRFSTTCYDGRLHSACCSVVLTVRYVFRGAAESAILAMVDCRMQSALYTPGALGTSLQAQRSDAWEIAGQCKGRGHCATLAVLCKEGLVEAEAKHFSSCWLHAGTPICDTGCTHAHDLRLERRLSLLFASTAFNVQAIRIY
jgi:hypothetical protein